MGDLAAVAFVVILVCVVIVVGVHIYNAGVRRKRVGAKVQLIARHPDEAPVALGLPVALDDPEFDTKIEERRSEAYVKLAALNSGKRGWKLEEHSCQ